MPVSAAVEGAVFIDIAPDQIAEGLSVEAKVNGHVGATIRLIA